MRAGSAEAVGDVGSDLVVADLAGTRGPVQGAGLGVVGGTLRQIAEGNGQGLSLRRTIDVVDDHGVGGIGAVGVPALDDGQREALADLQRVARCIDLRCLVDVDHLHGHGLVGGFGAVGGREREVEGLAGGAEGGHGVGRRGPFEIAGAGVEAGTRRQIGGLHHAEDRDRTVGIIGEDVEIDGIAFADDLGRHRLDDRCLVGVRDLEYERLRDLGHAVAGADGDGVDAVGIARRGRLRSQQARGPVQRKLRLAVGAGGLRHGHAGRQAAGSPVEDVAVRIECGKVDRGRLAFRGTDCRGAGVAGFVGDGLAAGLHLQHLRRSIAGLQDDVEVGRDGIRYRHEVGWQRRVGRRQATVGDGQAHVVVAQRRAGRRRPDQRRLTVLAALNDLRARRQALCGERQGVLVEIGGRQWDGQGLARYRDDLRRCAQYRRFREAGGREDEGRCRRLHLARVAAAVVAGGHGDGVVAALVHAWGEVDRAGGEFTAVALGKRGERRQAADCQRDRVAVRAACVEGHGERRALCHGSIGNRRHDRRKIGRLYHDGNDRRRRQAGAGAVAATGGGDGDVVGAGLRVARDPGDHRRIRIEAGALRQAGDLIGDRRCSDRIGSGSVGSGGDARLIVGVGRIEGEHADL